MHRRRRRCVVFRDINVEEHAKLAEIVREPFDLVRKLVRVPGF
jgi:hypothetical protein